MQRHELTKFAPGVRGQLARFYWSYPGKVFIMWHTKKYRKTGRLTVPAVHPSMRPMMDAIQSDIVAAEGRRRARRARQ